MDLEVATALLDASRRLSSGEVDGLTTSTQDVRNDGDTMPRVRTGSLAAAVAMLRSGQMQTDQLDNQSSCSGWLGGWAGGRTRALSESEASSSPSIKIGILSWLGVTNKNSPGVELERLQIRRSSSKDVEEAMAGGLSKADLYMPPI
eukprot:GFUD01023238.1.p1 GENE.GFUD01023238.1~~GFUD01023238.1.p1  ORF type:complete len:147 (-),score=40.70 GFUD01023238.1:149-589(-)